ncbi:serine/threonine protein kinase [Actinomadura graeca]|uniref:non-specific serine/threonine protein kinase n=2 Tax=Actinomadura graeca TaxID=2750812 RepID=A0ABX8R6V2_9ACTN|nr:serine/threonine protein kinase [Actinomadura graeca]
MVIDGRFELRGRLGSGGMGTVWRAFDLALEREVALKEVRLADTETSRLDPDVVTMLRERVMREARALARIHHPNVVTIHHIVDSPDMPHPWLVMELVRGESLHDRLEQGPMPPAEAAAAGRGILAALRAAHAAGICHRDVKPANVLLRTDGTPVLTDFGIAVLEEASRVTATGGLVGSPEYIAPERLHGHEGNPASDLWSLGVLLYVAVEGRNPLRRPTTAATLAAVMTAPIPPAHRAGPLGPVLQALLVREPAARPAGDHLDHLLSQAAAAAGPGTATGKGAASPMPGPTPVPGSMSAPLPSNPSLPSMQGPPPPPPGFSFPGGPGTNPNAFPPPIRITDPALRPRRRSPLTTVLIATLAAGAVAAVLTTFIVVLPKVLDVPGRVAASGRPNGTTPAGGTGGTGGPRGGGGGTTETKTLLTPAAIRGVIKKFEEASRSRRFAEFTVYEERADADAPVAGRRAAFDNYTYEKGADAAVRKGPSIAITTGDAKVDLNSFNWDALPALMQRAARTLKVPKPTMRYVIVRAAWTFNGDRPTMMIYFTDEYDGGYLAVNTKGKVISTVPADS